MPLSAIEQKARADRAFELVLRYFNFETEELDYTIDGDESAEKDADWDEMLELLTGDEALSFETFEQWEIVMTGLFSIEDDVFPYECKEECRAEYSEKYFAWVEGLYARCGSAMSA